MRDSNQNRTTVEGAGGFAQYYRSQSPKDFKNTRCYSPQFKYHQPVSILDGVTSGAIFRNGNSGQSTNFQDRPCFPLFATTPRPQSSQSLLDQISSGRIFVGNFHQNQTEIQCHHYSYTALSSNGSVIHSFPEGSLKYGPQNHLPSSNMNPKNTLPSIYQFETCLV